MKIRLLRHATTVIEYGGKRILVDPMLSPAGAADPIPTRSPGKGRRNPLVDLPVDAAELNKILDGLDGIFITHIHRDHFDDLEGKMLPKNLPVICQTEDGERLGAIGFSRLSPVRDRLEWSGITVTRYDSFHGGFYWRRKMGAGSGYVLEAPGEPTLYIPGDTVWCPPVRRALARHRPSVVLVNAGAARFPFGRSITMDLRDIAKVVRHAPQAKIVAVHMEAINHCLLTREKLRTFLRGKPYETAVRIPADGETLQL